MFSRKKKVAPVSDLTEKQIMEDLKACQDTDPVFELSQLLLNKNKVSPESETQKGTNSQSVSKPEHEPASSSKQNTKACKQTAVKGTDEKAPLKPMDKDKVYSNLNQCTSVCDEIAEQIMVMEPTLKKLGTDVSEFLQSIEKPLTNVENEDFETGSPV